MENKIPNVLSGLAQRRMDFTTDGVDFELTGFHQVGWNYELNKKNRTFGANFGML